MAPYLESGSLKEEACLAAVAIAEKIVQGHAKPVAEAMKLVAEGTASKQLAARAKALLRKAGNP